MNRTFNNIILNEQVRWPTRCKRCFRDYKEHADDRDKARFGNLKDNDSGNNHGPLTAAPDN